MCVCVCVCDVFLTLSEGGVRSPLVSTVSSVRVMDTRTNASSRAEPDRARSES